MGKDASNDEEEMGEAAGAVGKDSGPGGTGTGGEGRYANLDWKERSQVNRRIRFRLAAKGPMSTARCLAVVRPVR